MLDRRRFAGGARSPRVRAPHAIDAKRDAAADEGLVSRRVKHSSYFAVFAFFGGETKSLMPRNFLHTSLLER